MIHFLIQPWGGYCHVLTNTAVNMRLTLVNWLYSELVQYLLSIYSWDTKMFDVLFPSFNFSFQFQCHAARFIFNCFSKRAKTG